MPAGTTGTVIVTAAFSKTASAGDKQARLVVSAGGPEVAHAAVYAFVKLPGRAGASLALLAPISRPRLRPGPRHVQRAARLAA